MFNLVDPRRRLVRVLVCLFLLVSAPGLIAAQSEAPAAAAPEAAPSLRGRVEALYDVTAIPGGLLLEPRASRFGVRQVQVLGATVSVNGAEVPRPVLRSWLGEEAELILALADMRPRERRALFDLPEPTGAAARATAPESTVVVEVEQTEEAGEAEEAPGEVEAGTSAVVVAPDAGYGKARPPRPPKPPQTPRRHRRGDEVTVFRNLVIPEGESVNQAIAVMGSVRVDGEVRGDVTAVMGTVTVDGLVEGEVVAVGGSVLVGESGEITRDATSVGGRVERRPGGKVRGSVVEVPFLGGWTTGRDLYSGRDFGSMGRRHSWWGGMWDLFWWLVAVALCGLVASVVVLVAPRLIEDTSGLMRSEWWKAGLVGLLALLVFVPALVVLLIVLTITIIGIPLMVLTVIVTPFLVFGVWLLGVVAVARRVGVWALAKLGREGTSEYTPVIAGVLTLASFDLVGHLFDLMAVGLRLFAIPAALFHGLGHLVWFVAGVVGIGAVLLVLLARRRAKRDAPPRQALATYATPPAPDAYEAPPAEEAGEAEGWNEDTDLSWDDEPEADEPRAGERDPEDP